MRASLFLAPQYSWSTEEILGYFRNRAGIEYFAVLDEEQTTRELIDDLLEQRFTFIGETHQLSKRFDWRVNPSADLEWMILLHKFYYTAGLGSAYHETGDRRYVEKCLELTRSWIATMPLDFLPSDVAGRRIQNWIFAHYYFVTCNPVAPIPADFYVEFLASIAAQVNYLCDHLTPARNHRTLELSAVLLAAVVFPEFRDAGRWLDLAKRELLVNIQADLLPDGVHCELSTDYHHLVLKNYLWVRRLAKLNQVAMPSEMDERIRKALTFSLYVHKPDGAIPSLSDGDSRSFLDLLQQGYELYGDDSLHYVASRGRLGKAPADRSRGFSDGGYYILRSGWGDEEESFEDARYLIFDCGPLGRGNHGHFDLLNVEVAAYGESIIVDPGRYTYDESGETNWRARFRSTAYHNTVQVDRKNQTRYELQNTKFKIQGPEPDWELKEWRSATGYDYVRGLARSHEYEAVHERRIFFSAPEYWIVSDLLTAPMAHDYNLHFHLSEQAQGKVSVTRTPDGLSVLAPHMVLAQPFDGELDLKVEVGYVSRSYGVKHAAPVLRFARRAANTAFHSVLYPYKNERPEIAVGELPVWRGAERCSAPDIVALRIAGKNGQMEFVDYYFSANANSGTSYSFGPYTFTGSLLFVRDTAVAQGAALRFPADAELIDGRRQLDRVGS